MDMAFGSPAQVAGYVALVLGVSAFLQKSDTRLKVLIAAESVAYVAHFILLGNFPASGSAGVSCLRNLVSIRWRHPAWGALFIALNVAIGLSFAKGAAGWLPVTASCLATVAVFTLKGIPMRLVLLVCTLLWLANNLLSGSVGGTVLEAIIAVVNVATVCRMALVGRMAREGGLPLPPSVPAYQTVPSQTL